MINGYYPTMGWSIWHVNVWMQTHTHTHIYIIFVKHVNWQYEYTWQSQAVSAMERSLKVRGAQLFRQPRWRWRLGVLRSHISKPQLWTWNLSINLRTPKVTGAECLKDGLKNNLTLKRGPAELSLQMWVMVVSIYPPVMKHRNQKLSITVSYLSLLLHLHY